MQLRTLSIPGLVEIIPRKIEDARGYFSEVFRQEWFEKEIAKVNFVQENQSHSLSRGVLRGLHYQKSPMAQGKLVRCVAGTIFDVAVDVRRASSSFGKWEAVQLSASEGNQLWIPDGFLHGFCTLEANSIVCYKVTNYFSIDHDAGVAWDDPDIGIKWPLAPQQLSFSQKDAAQPRLADVPPHSHHEHR